MGYCINKSKLCGHDLVATKRKQKKGKERKLSGS